MIYDTTKIPKVHLHVTHGDAREPGCIRRWPVRLQIHSSSENVQAVGAECGSREEEIQKKDLTDSVEQVQALAEDVDESQSITMETKAPHAVSQCGETDVGSFGFASSSVRRIGSLQEPIRTEAGLVNSLMMFVLKHIVLHAS